MSAPRSVILGLKSNSCKPHSILTWSQTITGRYCFFGSTRKWVRGIQVLLDRGNGDVEQSPRYQGEHAICHGQKALSRKHRSGYYRIRDTALQ